MGVLRLSPDVRITRLAGLVTVEAGEAALALEGEAADVLEHNLLRRLAAGECADDPTASHGGDAGLVDAVLRALTAAGATTQAPAHTDGAVALLGALGAAPQAAPCPISEARVLVCAGDLDTELCDALALAGVGQVGRLADHAPGHLADTAPPGPGPWDLLIALGGRADAIPRLTASWAARNGVPVLHARLVGADLAVGPLVRAPGDPCGTCAERRRLAHVPAELVRAATDPDRRVLAATPPARVPLLESLACRLLAREAARALAGPPPARLAGAVLCHHLGSGEQRLHPLLASPGCPQCASASAAAADPCVGGQAAPGALLQGRPKRRAPARSVQRHPAWHDPRFGIVRDVELLPLHHVGGKTMWTAITSGVLPLNTAGLPLADLADAGRGAATSRREAVERSFAEVIERHAASHPLPACTRTRTAAAADLTEVLCAAELADPRLPLEWIQGRILGDGRPVWVPVAHAYLRQPPVPTLSPLHVSSNGLAAGPGFPAAAVGAVYELLERDAVMTTWYTRRPGLPVHVDDARTGAVLKALGELGVTARLYEIHAAVPVPAVFAVAFGDGVETPGAVVAAACHHDRATATRKAVHELASNVVVTRRELSTGATRRVERAEDIRDLADHGFFYTDPARHDAFDFLEPGGTSNAGPSGPDDVGTAPGRWSSPERALRHLAKLLGATGIRVATVDVTTPDVAVGTGLRVVRAVSPDLVPLWADSRMAPAGHPRLRTDRPHPLPHPFA